MWRPLATPPAGHSPARCWALALVPLGPLGPLGRPEWDQGHPAGQVQLAWCHSHQLESLEAHRAPVKCPHGVSG